MIINEEQEDGSLGNDITQLSAHIALAPIQTTTIYRQQLVERLTTVTGQLPPELQAVTFDLVAELMDIPNKNEFMERIRGAMNVPKAPDEMTPEEQQAAQQEAQQAAQQQELMMREVLAKVTKLEAETQQQQAKAAQIQQQIDSARFDDAKKQAETGKLLQEMQAVAMENEQLKIQLEQLNQELIGNIQAQIDAIPL